MNPPTHLRCEYEINPLGIDAIEPRLSWLVADSRRGAKQSAYQIIADDGSATLWDSGKAQSDQSVQVPYRGPALKSRQRVNWKVQTWDAAGEPSGWSERASWEMGLLRREDWKAKWIESEIVGGPYSIPPSPYLRKTFSLTKSFVKARLYVTALGFYEFEINGRRAGDAVFAPGRTDYAKRVPYHVFDVTSLLNSGENACGAILGDGWYCGHLHSDPRQTYGDRPRLLAQIEIQFTDGSSQMIASDETWKSGEGPIRSSDMLMGEDYDARMEINGWSAAGFDDSGWGNARVFADPGIEIVAHRAPPIRKLGEVKPIAPPKVSANKRRWIFDLGQNIVGRVRLKVRGKRGSVIDLRYVEMLDKDGKPYTQALRTARATDHYTTKGEGEEIFEPRFTFHGFRYVELRDYPGTPTVDDLTGIVLHSDTAPTGEFECSDPMINQLQRNIVWSQRGNFLDIPTDCPQRDERLGWTGDAQVFVRTASFNMDVANFFAKWMTDVADSQGDNGRIPSVVPHVKSLHDEGGPAWADAGVICPWTIYLCYGDEKILRDNYPMMARFMGFLREKSINFIRADEHWKWKGYGDWLSINAETPPDLIGTAFYAHCARLMSQISQIIGKQKEAEEYRKLFEQVLEAWQKRFVGADSKINVRTQTAYVLALHFDLLPESLRAGAFAALVEDIKSRDMHLSTGFVGTPYLNHVLTRFGRPDMAYALLKQTTFPSWLYPITQGATTIWERWDAWTHEKGFNDNGMNSFNHYAFGAVGDWLYAVVAGIDIDSRRPGYKHIIIQPRPGGGISSARGKLQSIHGLIESDWRVENSQLLLNVTIPPNTTASVRIATRNPSKVLEGGKPVGQSEGIRVGDSSDSTVTYEIGAGKYTFTIPQAIVE